LFNNRISIVHNLKLLIPNDVDQAGSLKTWGFHAMNAKHWNNLISNFKSIRDGDECTPPPPPTSSSPPSTPPRRKIPPPPPTPSPRQNMHREGIGSNMIDSLACLGLKPNVKERDVIIAYRRLSRKYRPSHHSRLNKLHNIAKNSLTHLLRQTTLLTLSHFIFSTKTNECYKVGNS